MVKGRREFAAAWLFVAKFENLTKSVSHMVCLSREFSGGGQRTAFFQVTQNGARAAIVFARQPKTHILKSSGF